jgi:hypothetical protein
LGPFLTEFHRSFPCPLGYPKHGIDMRLHPHFMPHDLVVATPRVLGLGGRQPLLRFDDRLHARSPGPSRQVRFVFSKIRVDALQLALEVLFLPHPHRLKVGLDFDPEGILESLRPVRWQVPIQGRRRRVWFLEEKLLRQRFVRFAVRQGNCDPM